LKAYCRLSFESVLQTQLWKHPLPTYKNSQTYFEKRWVARAARALSMVEVENRQTTQTRAQHTYLWEFSRDLSKRRACSACLWFCLQGSVQGRKNQDFVWTQCHNDDKLAWVHVRSVTCFIFTPQVCTCSRHVILHVSVHCLLTCTTRTSVIQRDMHARTRNSHFAANVCIQILSKCTGTHIYVPLDYQQWSLRAFFLSIPIQLPARLSEGRLACAPPRFWDAVTCVHVYIDV
jgi:hypothetical protein